jgi:hypothetical protein
VKLPGPDRVRIDGLGVGEGSTEPFVAEMRRIAAGGEVAEVEDTAFGRKYTVPGDLTGPAGLPTS